MDEEKTTDQENEEVNTEDVDETPKDDTGDESQDESQDDDSEDSEDQQGEADDSEYTENEAEYVKQFGFPDEVVDIHGALEYAKNLKDGVLPDVKRGQTEAQKRLDELDKRFEAYGGVDGFLSQNKPGAQQYNGGIPEFYVSDRLKRQLQSGEIDSDRVEYLSPVIEGFDSSLKQRDTLLISFDERLRQLEGSTESFASSVRQQEYDRFSSGMKQRGIPVEDRAKLDEIRKKIPGIKDYNQAQAFLVASDPDRFQGVVGKIQKKAQSAALKKYRGGGRYSMPGKGKASSGGHSADDFINPDGTVNTQKLESSGLSDKEQMKILDRLISKS